LGTAAEGMLPGGEVGEILRNPEDHEALVSRIYYRNPFIHPSVMFRRQFIERMGGYALQLRRAQDYDLWLRAYRHFRFRNLSQPLLRYQMRRRLSFRDVSYSAYVVWRALVRDHASWSKAWYVLRPFAGYIFRRLRCTL
jgi:hypothetical protein